jgi:hypothetical protein
VNRLAFIDIAGRLPVLQSRLRHRDPADQATSFWANPRRSCLLR